MRTKILLLILALIIFLGATKVGKTPQTAKNRDSATTLNYQAGTLGGIVSEDH
ncbi:MAG: hypothetical protein HOP08_18430 [Cyclobacteriaceae bacterium]|nr:hypothetical protein [Cyclobacteriaceae bacterium]